MAYGGELELELFLVWPVLIMALNSRRNLPASMQLPRKLLHRQFGVDRPYIHKINRSIQVSVNCETANRAVISSFRKTYGIPDITAFGTTLG